MPRALTWLKLYDREAVRHKHKNSLKAPKMHLSLLCIVIGVIYFRMEEIKTLYKFRPDEIFRRITVTSLATLMIECSKLEYQQEDSARLTRFVTKIYLHYGNTGCGVFKRGYEIRKIFA